MNIYHLIFLIFILVACKQSKNNKNIEGRANAIQELKSSLTDTLQHNVIDDKQIIIKDSLTAISIAEPILYSIYGKDNIIKQRPYDVYLIDYFWVIKGTLSQESLGGVFLIILDSRNARIIRITHEK